MQTSSQLRDGVSINLGFTEETNYDNSKAFRNQSWLRSWRRLSSLQRTVIVLILCICGLCVFYLGPSFHSDDKSEVLSVNRRSRDHNNREYPNNPEDHLPPKLIKEFEIDKQNKILDLKRKAQEQLDNLNKKEDKPIIEDKDSPDNNDAREEGDDKPNIDDKDQGAEQRMNNDKNRESQIEYDYFDSKRVNNAQQKAIIEAFQESWSAYRKYAWGHDEFHPISKGHSEWFGVGLTILDSLDTIIIMGLKEEYDQAREFVEKDLTFDKNQDVNLFEITIRVLGGMLSAYHLTGDNLYKEKAIDLGDRLLPCFSTPSGVPYSDVNLKTGRAHAPKWGPDSSTSEVTTLQLEFKDLSYVTGDPKYETAVSTVSRHIHNEPKKDGLVPIFINAQTGKLRASGTISVGARGDSYYEYLLKQWIQTGKTELMYKLDFVKAVEGMKTHLIRKSEPSKLTYIGELLSGRSFSPKMDHLVCFMGGSLAMASENGLGVEDEYMNLAKELTKTCYKMYERMPTKLSPEIVYFNQAQGNEEDLIVKPLDAHNLLRPETVESIFYMYRYTKDDRYREWGWKIFQAFKKHTRIEGFGYSSISNVKNAGSPGFRDKLESFFLAETLKYLYLLFSDDPDLIPLDKFVINTEAHPLPILKSMLMYDGKDK